MLIKWESLIRIIPRYINQMLRIWIKWNKSLLLNFLLKDQPVIHRDPAIVVNKQLSKI